MLTIVHDFKRRGIDRRRKRLKRSLERESFLSDDYLEELRQECEDRLRKARTGEAGLYAAWSNASSLSHVTMGADRLSRKLSEQRHYYEYLVTDLKSAYSVIQHERWRRLHEAGRVKSTYQEWESTQLKVYEIRGINSGE